MVKLFSFYGLILTLIRRDHIKSNPRNLLHAVNPSGVWWMMAVKELRGPADRADPYTWAARDGSATCCSRHYTASASDLWVRPWLMGSTGPNGPMEAFHADCGPAHPSRVPSTESHVTVARVSSGTGRLRLNPTAWLNGPLGAARARFNIVC